MLRDECIIGGSSSVAETVWERWQENSSKYPDREAIIHWSAEGDPYRWTFSSLLSAAESVAANLLDRGIKRGDVCAIVLRHNVHLYPIYMGISLIGGIPAILAYPNPRLHPDKFRQGLRGMSQRSGLDWIFTERALEETIRPLIEEGSTIRGLQFPLEWEREKRLEGEALHGLRLLHKSTSSNEPFLLQHSSGTTGLQKPVLLSHRAILDHVAFYGSSIALTDEDKIVSWLPLYHDMGLIAALHLPLSFGIPVVQIDPFEWVQVPSLLLDAVSKERGTISWLPNFAYNLMSYKVSDEDLEGIDLQSWRLLVNCSEPIRNESHDKFFRRFQSCGLRKAALSSCYAMAETTFAITQNPPGSELVPLVVDRVELSRGKVKIAADKAPSRTCVSSGKVIDGCEVRIVNEDGDAADGVVGEVVISSVSMFDGYRNYPEKTAEVLRNGWYYSGDYGFRMNGDVYIIGRKKDVIIVAGNNISPEDVEDMVGEVAGVIPGRVVAFGEEDKVLGSEQVSVIVETSIEDEGQQKDLRLAVIQAGMSIDVSIAKVYMVPPRWLIKSSAGKPSRKANKERVLNEGPVKRA